MHRHRATQRSSSQSLGNRPGALHQAARNGDPCVLLLGPDLTAVSGISTHVNQLFGSPLRDDFRLLHFPAGSGGRESWPEKLTRLAFSPWRLVRVVRAERPDIVHVNSTMDRKAFWRDLAYLAVARGSGVRSIVLQIHGGQFPDAFTKTGAVRKPALKAQLRMADLVVLLSDAERRAYETFLPGLPMRVVPNAVGFAGLDGGSGLRDGRDLRLAFLGRLVEEKGLFEAVEAVALLRERGIPVSFSIAGSGPAEQKLSEKISKLGLGAHVRLLGPVFGAAKDRLWAWADALVLPTFHKEGLPYALLEAMAAGVLPITCREGAIPDVMEDGVHGLFVSPHDPVTVADAVEWIHHHREQAHSMAVAARERVAQNYTLDRMTHDFRNVYLSLLSKRASPDCPPVTPVGSDG